MSLHPHVTLSRETMSELCRAVDDACIRVDAPGLVISLASEAPGYALLLCASRRPWGFASRRGTVSGLSLAPSSGP
jgi:hypothetical protein